MPQRVQLKFATLADLADGTIDVLLQKQLARIAADCLDRPGDKTKRVVMLEFIPEPVVGQDGGCDHAKLTIECKAKVPVHRTRPYEMQATKAGFLFNVDDEESLDQEHLFPRCESSGVRGS